MSSSRIHSNNVRTQMENNWTKKVACVRLFVHWIAKFRLPWINLEKVGNLLCSIKRCARKKKKLQCRSEESLPSHSYKCNASVRYCFRVFAVVEMWTWYNTICRECNWIEATNPKHMRNNFNATRLHYSSQTEYFIQKSNIFKCGDSVTKQHYSFNNIKRWFFAAQFQM